MIFDVSALFTIFDPNMYGLAVEATVPKADEIPIPRPLT
jgi:hypothetical protein